MILDKEGIIVMANPQAEEFLKVVENNILGKQFAEAVNLSNLKPITSTFDFKKIWGIFEKETFSDIDKGIILEIDTIPLRGGDDDFGKLLMIRDITRERNIEKTKDEFVALAAHQLRTPLSAIKWTLAILLDGRVGKISDEQRSILERVIKAMTE